MMDVLFFRNYTPTHTRQLMIHHEAILEKNVTFMGSVVALLAKFPEDFHIFRIAGRYLYHFSWSGLISQGAETIYNIGFYHDPDRIGDAR